MVTTVMLLSVLAALVKSIIFSDDHINSKHYDADMSLAVPHHYGTVKFGTTFDDNYIRIEVDPDTLAVTSFWEIDSKIDGDSWYGLAVTWDVVDHDSIGRDILLLYRNINTFDWFAENSEDEKRVVNIKINKLAAKMKNKVIKIDVD